MKKFIRNCMYVLAIIILLSFILPSFSAKADTVTVNGKVTDKNGDSVEGIKVTLCDNNGNPYNGGRINATTNNEGKYSISVPESMGDYKLRFEYSGYKSAKAEQIGVKDYIHNSQKCKKLETRYVVPKEEKDTLEKRGIIKKELDKCGGKLEYSTEEHWITYDKNNVYDENGNVSKYPSLMTTVKRIETSTGLFPNIANIAIIIKATNNMPGIEDYIKPELSSTDSIPVKYKYFVLDSNNIFSNLNVKEEKTIICKTEDELIEEVCKYIGFKVDTDKKIDVTESNDEKYCITKTISNVENTTINLTLGDKKEDTQETDDPDSDDPGHDDPAPEDPTPPTPPTPPSEPDLPPAGDSDNIRISIWYKNIEDNENEKKPLTSDYPVEVNLNKTSPPGEEPPDNNDNNKSYRQSDGTNTYGLSYIEHVIKTENDKKVYSTAGDYTITVKVGNRYETTKANFNGQNYEVESVKVNGNDIGLDGFNKNRKDIDSKFALVNKNNAQWVNPQGQLHQNTILEGTVKINNVPNVNVPFATQTKYEVEIVLKERPKFELEVTQEISAAQMILSNGQILKSYKAGDGTGSGMIGDKIVWDVDDELKHGATVQIEYEIKVKNTGEVDCTEFTLIDYLDYNNASLQYRSDANLITENEKNSKYRWKVVSTDSDFNELKSATSTTLDKGKTYLQLTDGDGRNTIIGKKTGEKTYKLVASMVITSELAIDNYQNAVEIISYKNAIGRVDRSATPGTYNPNLNVTNDNEHDSAKAHEVSIIPPTGTKPKWYTQLLETILNMFI